MTRVCVFEPDWDPVHQEVLRAFAKGCDAKVCDLRHYEPCDVAVIFGLVKQSFAKSHLKAHIIRAHKGPLLVLERGWLNREHYWSAGYDGINGAADFRNADVPGDRWRKLGIDLAPWRDGGDYALVCGQVPWDVTVQDQDHKRWCRETVRKLRKAGHEVRFRPHPYAVSKGVDYRVPTNLVSRNASLAQDLAGAMFCATWNSTAGVEAAVAGVPVVVSGFHSMADPVASRGFRQLVRPDRTQWAHGLAYGQWTLEEFRAGRAWRHLRP